MTPISLQPLSEMFSGPTGLGFSQPHAVAATASSDDDSSGLNAEEEEPKADDIDDIDETKPYSSLFREFIELRRRCGERTDNVSYDSFARSLQARREEMRLAHGGKDIAFQVAFNDGKAVVRWKLIR